MFRWEIATVVACSVLGVNAFDQPNVETSKKITKAKIAEYQKKGKLKEGKPASEKAFLKTRRIASAFFQCSRFSHAAGSSPFSPNPVLVCGKSGSQGPQWHSALR